MKKITLFVLLLASLHLEAQQFFQPIAENAISLSATDERKLIPERYATFQLETDGLSAWLAAAPMEFTAAAKAQTYRLAVPQADGTLETFAVWKVMACGQEVYDKHPEIRTFGGVSLSTPGKTIRGSVTVRGCRIMIMCPDYNVQFVEPYAWGQTKYYMVYDRRDIAETDRFAVPGSWDGSGSTVLNDEHPYVPAAEDRGTLLTPVELKVFRFGVACTAQFAQDHGGTHDLAWAAVIEYTNMVSAIFERDIDLRLQMVPASEAAVFLNPITQPFTGTTVQDWMGQSPSVLDFYVGTNNFDVGHVYARYLGGSASGVAGGISCTNSKARGCSSGSGSYGAYFINVVGQEIGHQMSGGHSWNRCGGGSGRAGNTAFEPGSGSTIMSYAGACGSDNVQGYSDLYYHSGSIAEIRNFITFGTTGCGSSITTDNQKPEVTLDYQDNFFIPIGTPFELNGSGTDADGDTLAYSWEEIDLGPECPLQTPVGSAPLFRTWPAGPATNRYFPKLSTILNNGFDVTEQLPTITRDMTFRFTARDNRSNGGGVAWADVAFKATEDAGPFVVLYPNTAADNWQVGAYVNVSWDVANTNHLPVNCQYVNIRLSTDGGQTYPITLADHVPNDGSQLIQVPDAVTTQARVRIDAVDNVFFDISNAKFKIVQPTQPALALGLSNDGGRICLPDHFNADILSTGLLGYTGNVQVDLIGALPANANYAFSTQNFQPGADCHLDIDLSSTDVSGGFDFEVRAISGADTLHLPIHLDLVRNDFSQMALTAPADGLTAVSTGQSMILRWTAVPDADSYDVQFAKAPDFAPGNLLATKTGTVVDSFKVPLALLKNQIYYWRVRPVNVCGAHDWLDTRSFQTEVLSCTDWTANDLPKNLTANGTPTIESKINVLSSGPILDINVKQIQGYHGFFKDLDAKLISPQGTEVVLFAQKCGNFSGAFDFALDDEALSAFACPPSNSGGAVKPDNLLSAFDGENLNGLWTLRVHDGVVSSGGMIEGFQLEFCAPAQFNSPFLVKNNVLLLDPGTNQAVSNDLLLAQDIDNTAAEIVYTLVNTPHFGRLEKNWSGEMKPGDTFTQADLDNGAIRYFNYGFTPAGDYFRFTLTDPEGGFLGTPKFIIQSASPLANGEPKAAAWQLNLYPNPTTGTVWLSTNHPGAQTTQVRVLSANGLLVQQLSWPAGSEQLALESANLPAGIYWVQCSNEQVSAVRRLVVLH